MRLLLDTHTFLFAINPVERLSPTIRNLLADPDQERWVSTVTLWEIAIKISIRKLPLPTDRAYYYHHIDALRARILPVELRHSLALMDLPLLHRDPFDRLLVAQAKEDDLTLVTRDAALTAYPVPTIW